MLMCACNHNRSKQVNQKDVVSESEKSKTDSDKEAVSDSDMKSEKNNSDVAGTYVTESYKLRSEGYDWVAVRIKGAQDRMIDV